MIVVRRAKIEDEAGVFELFRQFPSSEVSPERRTNWQAGTSTFREIIDDSEKGSILVAEEDGEVVGVITLSYPVAIRCAGIYTCIEEFIVSQRMRGRGVGGQLLEAAIDEATARGCYEIQVNRPSELGYPVYLEHGWEDLGKHLNMRLPRK
jgi:GNAT superfamily N-acetyltransferase